MFPEILLAKLERVGSRPLVFIRSSDGGGCVDVLLCDWVWKGTRGLQGCKVNKDERS